MVSDIEYAGLVVGSGVGASVVKSWSRKGAGVESLGTT